MKYAPNISLFPQKKSWITIGFILLFAIGLHGQNQKLADSLKLIYNLGMVPPKNQLKTLKLLVESYHDPEYKLIYSDILIEEAFKRDSIDYIFSGYLYKGDALARKGNYTMALENYNKASQIALKGKSDNNLALTYSAIGSVHASLDNNKNTLDYYTKSMMLFKSIPDSANYAFALEKIGDYYLTNKKPDSALMKFKESGQIFRAIDHEKGIGSNFGSIGMVYAQKGQTVLAEKYIQQATKILTLNKDYDHLAIYLLTMANIYLEKGDNQTAYYFANKSLVLAKEYGLKEQISDAYLKLSHVQEANEKPYEALDLFRSHVSYRDSLHNYATIQQMADYHSDFEISMKQREIDSLNYQKENQQIIVIAIVIALFLISLLAFGLFLRYRFIHKTNLIIEKEMNRSDHLLNNILPLETAQELKECGKVKAKKFESVTVMFTDFKEFTIHSEHLSPEQLVNSVNYYFSKFDEIIGKYGLEKIKTIGDSYMCAGGLPFPCTNHPIKVTLAAFEIIKFVEEAKQLTNNGLAHFDVRIGINTGPVVAGVVGIRKFAYDIWGDAVNIASRMETNCESGKINISENTYSIINESFDCEYRGEIQAKNKGKLKMYYAKELKNQDTIPNQFSTRENEETNMVL